jgi:hypothetical protein
MSLLTDIVFAYNFEGNSNDEIAGNNGTDTNITYGTSYGKIGQGALAGSSNSVIVLPTAVQVSPPHLAQSFSIWFKTGAVTSGKRIFNFDVDGSGEKISYCFVFGTNTVDFHRIRQGYPDSIVSTAFTDTTNWHHLVGTWDGTYIYFYFDGTYIGSLSCAGDGWYTFTNYAGVGFGGTNINIDMFYGWSRKITSEEVTELWNSGVGLQYPFIKANGLGFLNFFK